MISADSSLLSRVNIRLTRLAIYFARLEIAQPRRPMSSLPLQPTMHDMLMTRRYGARMINTN